MLVPPATTPSTRPLHLANGDECDLVRNAGEYPPPHKMWGQALMISIHRQIVYTLECPIPTQQMEMSGPTNIDECPQTIKNVLSNFEEQSKLPFE